MEKRTSNDEYNDFSHWILFKIVSNRRVSGVQLINWSEDKMRRFRKIRTIERGLVISEPADDTQ